MNLPPRHPFTVSLWAARLAAGLALVLLANAGIAVAQVKFKASASDFTALERDDSGRKSVVRGEKGEPLGDNRFLLTGLRLEVYKNESELETVIQAPECVYDAANKTAHSEGRLSVETAGGDFSIEGVGFAWRQDASSLVISNSVRTVIQRDLFDASSTGAFQGPSASGAPVSWPLPPSDPEPTEVKIQSDHFEYGPDLAVFTGNVRADEPQGVLTCELLRAVFAEGDLQRIEALGNVVIEQEDGRATGDRAIYQVKEEFVRLEGDPTWTAGDREGRADLLIIDRQAGQYRAEGHVAMALPFRELMPETLPAEGEPKPPAAEGAGIVNVFSDRFAYDQTGGSFEGGVRVEQAGNEITSERLILSAADPSDPPTEIEAQGNVQMVFGDVRADAERARFRQDGKELILTGSPHWGLEGKEGWSDRLTVRVEERTLRAEGNVRVRLPLDDAPQLGLSAAAPSEAVDPGTADFIEVRAHAMDHHSVMTFFEHNRDLPLSETNRVEAQSRRLRIGSGFLSLFFLGAADEVTQVVADREVVIEDDERTALGDKAVYDVAQRTVELTGHPKIVAPDRVISASRVVLDRDSQEFRFSAPYRIEWKGDALRRSAQEAKAVENEEGGFEP